MSRSVGFRVFDSPQRPPRKLIDLFRGIPVANIADTMNRLYCVDASIRQINGRPLLGCALTVKTVPGDNLVVHKAMRMAQPGDIAVIDGGGCMDRSLAGDIMIKAAAKHGLAGFVFDGCVRDTDGIAGVDISVYARGVTPCGPYKNGPGEINVPVCIGGQVVLPGDILVGDTDGIVVIRPEDAEETARLAKAHTEKEVRMLQDIEKDRLDTAWVETLCAEKGLAYL